MIVLGGLRFALLPVGTVKSNPCHKYQKQPNSRANHIEWNIIHAPHTGALAESGR